MPTARRLLLFAAAAALVLVAPPAASAALLNERAVAEADWCPYHGHAWADIPFGTDYSSVRVIKPRVGDVLSTNDEFAMAEVKRVRVVRYTGSIEIVFRTLPGVCAEWPGVEDGGIGDSLRAPFQVVAKYRCPGCAERKKRRLARQRLTKAEAVAGARDYARKLYRSDRYALSYGAECRGRRVARRFSCDAILGFRLTSGERYRCFYGVEVTRSGPGSVHVRGVGGVSVDNPAVDGLNAC